MSQVISFTGDWFNTIAAVMLLNRYTDSGLAIGAFFLARSLPPFLLGPTAGVIADRFNRKTILIWTHLLRMVVVLGFLLVNSAENIWLIYVIAVLQFMISAFFQPAYAAILPSLVEDEELLTANTLGTVTWSTMLTVGAVIGGATAAVFGAEAAFVIDSLTFAAAAGCVYLIQIEPDRIERTEQNASGWSNFKDGLSYVRSH